MAVCDLTCVTVQFGSAVRNIFLHGLLISEEMFHRCRCHLVDDDSAGSDEADNIEGHFPRDQLEKILSLTLCGFIYVCVCLSCVYGIWNCR